MLIAFWIKRGVFDLSFLHFLTFRGLTCITGLLSMYFVNCSSCMHLSFEIAILSTVLLGSDSEAEVLELIARTASNATQACRTAGLLPGLCLQSNAAI